MFVMDRGKRNEEYNKKFVIHPDDNVYIDLESKYKVAAKDINMGENIVKYGFPIGRATVSIKKGEYVHTDNMMTNLEGVSEFCYRPCEAGEITEITKDVPVINGYVRKTGMLESEMKYGL